MPWGKVDNSSRTGNLSEISFRVVSFVSGAAVSPLILLMFQKEFCSPPGILPLGSVTQINPALPFLLPRRPPPPRQGLAMGNYLLMALK